MRLIDANVVLAKQFTTGLSDASGNHYGNADVVFADDIENAPTVDAVEVVRCGFCKNAEPYDCTIDGTIHRLYECKKDKMAIGYNKVVAKDDFCSCGERKVGDRNG